MIHGSYVLYANYLFRVICVTSSEGAKGPSWLCVSLRYRRTKSTWLR